MFFAGMDTTGNLSGMSLYCLGKYKDIHKKVIDEINSVITDFDNITLK